MTFCYVVNTLDEALVHQSVRFSCCVYDVAYVALGVCLTKFKTWKLLNTDDLLTRCWDLKSLILAFVYSEIIVDSEFWSLLAGDYSKGGSQNVATSRWNVKRSRCSQSVGSKLKFVKCKNRPLFRPVYVKGTSAAFLGFMDIRWSPQSPHVWAITAILPISLSD